MGASVFLWPGLGSPVLARRAQWLALAGALMFAASDGLLAVKLFVRPLPGASDAIMLLYWAAQACIATSARESLASPSSVPSPGLVSPGA